VQRAAVVCPSGLEDAKSGSFACVQQVLVVVASGGEASGAIYQVEKGHVARCILLPLALALALALSLTDSGRTSRRGRCRLVECFSLCLFFSEVR
jgi:hypothetical protein